VINRKRKKKSAYIISCLKEVNERAEKESRKHANLSKKVAIISGSQSENKEEKRFIV